MALFRKFFYRKPPDGLLEIVERVYVFDYCFTTDVVEEQNYKGYISGIVGQLCAHLPDSSFMVFNFHEGENQSHIGDILQEYDMTVIDYPRQYEGCPLLTMEMIHHCLKSGESWLMLGQNNVLLMHCERGGWPILAFMLAALLIYRKLYSGEQKTLDMIHKQAPRELLQLMSPLNPLPSQLRYLQYVSRRNLGSEWPPSDRALILDCIILRFIPNMDGEGGCRPILRIYGRDPCGAGRSSKVLFSTPKRSRNVRYYKQGECELVKIDIHCSIQGDVVFECISLNDDLEREQMMFRVMFSTAFIRSNILMLNRDEIDTLWNAKDWFPTDFRAEILFSEMESAASDIPLAVPVAEEKEGLPVEAFAKVREFFNSVDWDSQPDVTPNVLEQIIKSKILQENSEMSTPKKAELGTLEGFSPGKPEGKPKSPVLDNSMKNSPSQDIEKQSQRSLEAILEESSFGQKTNSNNENASSIALENRETAGRTAECGSPAVSSPHQVTKGKSETSGRPVASTSLLSGGQSTPSSGPLDADVAPKKTQPEDLLPGNQQSTQPKVVSPHIIQSPRSSSGSYSSSPQGSPMAMQRFHGSPSSVGITALLHDDNVKGDVVAHLVTVSPKSPANLVPSASDAPKFAQQNALSSSAPLPSPPAGPSEHSAPQNVELSVIDRPPSAPPAELPSSQLSTVESKVDSALSASGKSHLTSSVPPIPQPSSPFPRKSVAPPPPPPPPSSLGETPPPNIGEALPAPSLPPAPLAVGQYPSTLPVPPPPPPPPLPCRQSPSANANSSLCTPPPPPPPPPPPHPSLAGTVPAGTDSPSSNPRAGVKPPHPPPPPNLSISTSAHSISSSAPPPPPPPNVVSQDVGSSNSPKAPPPPPAPLGKGLEHGPSQSPKGLVPPPPGPLGGKGRVPLRLSSKHQGQSKKTNLKPYHWLKLTRVMQGSLWAEALKSDEEAKAPEIDLSELENLFAASVPNSEKGGAGGKSSCRALGTKSDKVQLIELRRAYNCEIMLTKVKIPLPDLMNSVLALDDSALDVDQVENLIKFCPTNEEMELLKGYKGDKDNLGKCEQFFLELMKVPRVESKLRVFAFKIHFNSQVSELRQNLNIVNSASEEIRTSTKLKKIMQTILSLGNALNHGTARGSAVGFRLDSLLKLTDTRARNNKMTLMHYLCKVLAEKMPELLDFSKDLASLEAATKIQLKYLAEEMQAISKGLEKVVQELTASGNDGPISEHFRKTLKEFLGHAEGEVRSLASRYSTVGRNADALAMYFGEDPAKCPFEQVVSTLLNFVKMFNKAHEENLKQIEFEKKKAEKDAENERLKVAKDSEQHVSSPRKFGTVK